MHVNAQQGQLKKHKNLTSRYFHLGRIPNDMRTLQARVIQQVIPPQAMSTFEVHHFYKGEL